MHKYMQFVGEAASLERLVFAIDKSSSMDATDWDPSRLGGAVEAFSALLEVKAGRYPRDEVGLVAFDSYATAVHDLAPAAQSRASLESKARSLRTGASTNIAAGLAAAGGLLSGRASRTAPGFLRHALTRLLFDEAPAPTGPSEVSRILLLTDGHSNTGGSPRQIAERLKRAGVTIDIVGIGGSSRAVDEKLLKHIASPRADGSPRYCFIGDTGELVKTFRTLAHHLRPAGGA